MTCVIVDGDLKVPLRPMRTEEEEMMGNLKNSQMAFQGRCIPHVWPAGVAPSPDNKGFSRYTGGVVL